MRNASDGWDRFGEGLPTAGLARVSRRQVWRGSPDPAETSDRRSPHSPAGRPSVGSVARSETGHNRVWLGQRPPVRRGSPDGRFGEGLPTAGSARVSRPRRERPTEGLPVRRPGDLRSAAWLGQRPATTETFGRQRGSVRDRPQQRSAAWLGQRPATTEVGSVGSETGHNRDRPQQRPATTAVAIPRAKLCAQKAPGKTVSQGGEGH